MPENKNYSFENNSNSCVIKTTAPPRYWYNYLWNENGYCAQVSQTGAGISYYINEKADMCQINGNQDRFIYLRNDDNGECWNIGESPLLEKVENFSCEHSIAFSNIKSEYKGIHASWRIFVPSDGYHEVWTIKLKNNKQVITNLSVFSVVSFYLEGFPYPRYYEMYRCCETFFDKDLNGVFCLSKHPFAPHARYNGYIAASLPVYSYDGDLNRFCGYNGSLQRPEIPVYGKDCTNSRTALFTLGGVLQNKISLKPSEEIEFQILFGVSESLSEAVEVRKKYSNSMKVEASLKSTSDMIYGKYASLSVKTPDVKINNLMNNWLKKQVDFCIVGKKGVRDNLQITVALMMYRLEKAKAEILEVLRHQFRNGHAVLTWYPYDDTRYSDQPFWIVWAVIELIKETGDYGILDTQIEYQDGGSGTVLEHMKAAIARLLEDTGPNGLTKLWFADWNDALNVTTDPEAESVMLTEQLCLALKEFSILMKRLGDTEYALWLSDKYNEMRNLLNEKAWDGEWYARALSKFETIGSKNSNGSKIYVNAQTWAILADIPDDKKLPLVLKSIDAMEHPFGFPINHPPYMEYSPHIGRMGGMLPGLFENGGVYCHATAFKMMMDCKLGRGDKALETLHKIMPDSKANPSMNSGAEPYVFTNCYAIHPHYYGKSYQSWTTGTSAWVMRGLYEGIMGLRRDYEGLRISPSFPVDWDRAEVTRTFRGAKYHVTIINKGHKKSPEIKITVDGKVIEGNILPLFNDDFVHEVKVELL
jgi:cellobiose phosphorylase